MTFSPYVPAGMSSHSAIQEWSALTSQILTQLEASYDQIARPLRLWERNDLASLVAATAPGELVGDGALTREQVIARSTVFQSLLVWLQTPILIGLDAANEPIHVTPMDLLSQR